MARSKAATRRLTTAQIEAALRKHQGNVSAAARHLNCTRSTIALRIHRSAHLRAVVEECRETIKDVAEHNLFKKVLEGDIGCSQWVLARLARERGYGDKTEIPLTGSITVELVWGDDSTPTPED